jgi:serine/threonine-protein kinase ATR
VSRVGHSNLEVYQHLKKIITMVLQEYPKQALWLFTSVAKSKTQIRKERGKAILDQLHVRIRSCFPRYLLSDDCSQSNPANTSRKVPLLITQLTDMTNELLALCDYHIPDDSRKTLTVSRDFPKLAALRQSLLIIPLQESLNANLPPNSSSESIHQPFPANAPTFESRYKYSYT